MKNIKIYLIILLFFIITCITLCFIPIRVSKLIPLIEQQVSAEYGVNVHLDRVILRFGPYLKLKSPIVHVMYKDGQKFAQFDNLKVYIPWGQILNKNIRIKKIYAKKCIVNIDTNDKYIPELINILNDKKSKDAPNIYFKKYVFSIKNQRINRKYRLIGDSLDSSKNKNYDSWKISTLGNFFINDKKYLSYDISVVPQLNSDDINFNFDIESFLEKMEDLDFHSDIIADLKISKKKNGEKEASGLINFDNILVLDPAQKTPKSFIYLTFLGDKMSVLSNIYTSPENKIFIEGIINNSQKRSIDLKVKTDNVSLKDLFVKIKLITNLSRYKNIEYIDGNLYADFNIKGDIKKIKSFGFLKIKDASVVSNGIKLSNIIANIDFSNNIINITDATGYINNSPIMVKGKIDKNIDIDLIMSKISLAKMFPKSCGIKNGLVSLSANIQGSVNNIVHKENISIENFKYNKNNIDLSFDSLKFDTNKDNIAYVSNILINNKFTEAIKLPAIKILVNKDSINIPDTNIYLPNSSLKLQTEVLDYSTNNLTFSTRLNGYLNSKDIRFLKKQNSEKYPIKSLICGNKKSQNITTQLYMDKPFILNEPSLLNFVAKIENNDLKIEDFSLSSFSGKFTDDFKQNLKGSKKAVITGHIENLNKKTMFKNLRIFIPQQINLEIFDTIAQVKGDLFLNGPVIAPDMVGQISLQNIINQFFDISINNATVDFNKLEAVLNAPQIKFSDSVMGAHAIFNTNFSHGINIKNLIIKSKYINSDTFLMYKDTPAFGILPIISIKEGKLYSERALASLYKSSLNLTGLSSGFRLDNNILTFNNLTAELYNGKIAGDIKFNLKDESFETKIQARNVSASPIFDIISTKKETISGSMDFDTELNGNISSKSTLNGKIKFLVNNGHMGTLGKLEHLLYAQNVVADSMLRTSLSVVTKAITLKDTGLFKFLRGEVFLNNGIAEIKYLQSQGPLMSLLIKGYYNPDTDYARLIVFGRLADDVISGLGAFGDFSFKKLLVMATGEEDENNEFSEDIRMLPQLPMKNTKEFRSIIDGFVEKASSVIKFNWISYSTKSYKQKEVPVDTQNVPDFVDSLPY